MMQASINRKVFNSFLENDKKYRSLSRRYEELHKQEQQDTSPKEQGDRAKKNDEVKNLKANEPKQSEEKKVDEKVKESKSEQKED